MDSLYTGSWTQRRGQRASPGGGILPQRRDRRALAKEYGGAAVYTDLDAFLADKTVNVVYVASPNSLHYSQVKAALRAGKHVICEKPFTPTLAQAQELVTLAQERGLMLVDAVPTTYLPNYELLQRELPKLGRVRLVLANYSQYSSRYDKFLAGEVPNVFNPAFMAAR